MDHDKGASLAMIGLQGRNDPMFNRSSSNLFFFFEGVQKLVISPEKC